MEENFNRRQSNNGWSSVSESDVKEQINVIKETGVWVVFVLLMASCIIFIFPDDFQIDNKYLPFLIIMIVVLAFNYLIILYIYNTHLKFILNNKRFEISLKDATTLMEASQGSIMELGLFKSDFSYFDLRDGYNSIRGMKSSIAKNLLSSLVCVSKIVTFNESI